MSALFFILLSSSSLEAAEAEPCEGWYQSISLYAQDIRDSAMDSANRYREEVRQGGARYVFVRHRSEEELATSYARYFFPEAGMPAEGAGAYVKALAKIRNIATVKVGDRRFHIAPLHGTVSSLDRLFLGSYTARGPIKMGFSMVGSFLAAHYLFYKPLESFATSHGFSNAAKHALDHDYSFRALRKEREQGRLSRADALLQVKTELKIRRRYFDLIRQQLGKDPEATVESIAIQFAPLLRDEKLRFIFSDLHYLLSSAFQRNPQISWKEGGPQALSEAQFRELFTLNHIKLYGFTAASEWLAPSFREQELKKNDPPAFAVYRELILDPFVQELIGFRKNGRLSQVQLEELVLSDLEWKIRFAQLAALRAGIKGPEGTTLTLGDRRVHLLQQHGLKTE